MSPQPLFFSEAGWRASGRGWFRAGDDCCYLRNNIRRQGGAACYYTLTFEFRADADADTVYCAHCYPYTYTDLCRHLDALGAEPVRGRRAAPA